MVEIKGIIWSESAHEFYATLYVNGEFMVSATLDYCIGRAKKIAEARAVRELSESSS